MVALGKKNVKVQQTGWALDKPAPREIGYEITWS